MAGDIFISRALMGRESQEFGQQKNMFVLSTTNIGQSRVALGF